MPCGQSASVWVRRKSLSLVMGRLHAMKLKYQKVGISYVCVESHSTVTLCINRLKLEVFLHLEHLIFDPVVFVVLCMGCCITVLG